MLEGFLVSLLIKLAAVASVASVLSRSNHFKGLLMHESRSLSDRMLLALWLAVTFGASVAVRLVNPERYEAVDLGLEGCLIAGIIGGYVTGLSAGVLVALPALIRDEGLSLPLMAGIGVLGGLLRDCASDPEEVWRFSPFVDLSIYRFFREKLHHGRAAFQLVLLAAIGFAEFLRQTVGGFFPRQVFRLSPPGPEPHPLLSGALYVSTVFAVAIPLKIWNNTRNERKLEEQARLLVEARLAALTSQINPHFLFNTLNSVSSLIRTNPAEARVMVAKLAQVMRRLLRKHETFSPLRDELSFIEDYLAIEMVRFGEKLRFEKEVAADVLDMMVPSMLLQPLVENSIKHGLGSKVEGGTIRIRASRQGVRLLIEVSDDGVGIPEERLAALLEQGGIGVRNVRERLEVLFGSDYRMWVDSHVGEGTSVRIDVPELQPTRAQS